MANALDHLAAGRTRIEWLSQLNTEYTPPKNYRRTSIICTIGPKTNSPEKINALRKAGLNVVRMNFSHGSYEVRHFCGIGETCSYCVTVSPICH
jgi:pyruvate kinase